MPASVLVVVSLLAAAFVVAAVWSARRDFRDSRQWIEQLEHEPDEDDDDREPAAV